MNALEVIRLRIRTELNELTDQVINGGCPDFAAYRYACGQALGLVRAEDIVKEIEERLNRDDPDGDDERDEREADDA